MNANNDFSENIRDLAICNMQLKAINERAKPVRQHKQTVSKYLVEYMTTRNIKTRAVEINSEPMRLVQKNEYSPLTMGFIRNCLEDIMEDADQIDTVMDYLREQRETKTTVELRPITSRSSRRSQDGYDSAQEDSANH